MNTALDKRTYSGTALKWLACVSMLLDHIGASCIEAGAFRAAPALTRSGLFALDIALRMVGRLAFPIYSFLLVEGFVHTHRVRGYALRLLGFALLSEAPFDLAFYGRLFYWQHQNVYWTLVIGLAAMALMERLGNSDSPPDWRGLLAVAACAALAQVLHTDYGATGVLLITALYALRADRRRQCVVGAVLTLYELTAPLAFLPLMRYSGARGCCGKAEKWAYYWFYPAHLALLAAVTKLVIIG